MHPVWYFNQQLEMRRSIFNCLVTEKRAYFCLDLGISREGAVWNERRESPEVSQWGMGQAGLLSR